MIIIIWCCRGQDDLTWDRQGIWRKNVIGDDYLCFRCPRTCTSWHCAGSRNPWVCAANYVHNQRPNQGVSNTQIQNNNKLKCWVWHCCWLYVEFCAKNAVLTSKVSFAMFYPQLRSCSKVLGSWATAALFCFKSYARIAVDAAVLCCFLLGEQYFSYL